jgi:hypothetical protein
MTMKTNSLEIEPNPPAEEVELHHCGYKADCRAKLCRNPGAFIARYNDDRGYFLRQFELCHTHIERLQIRDTARGLKILDLRKAAE